MTETRNHRKRNRENKQSPQNPIKTTDSPPPKKRRISAEHKKSRGKDITKWSINELKQHLKQNGITFQLKKDKAYYIRLVTKHRNKNPAERNQTPKSERRVSNQNGSTQSPPLLNGTKHAPKPVHSPPISDNSTSSDSSNSPEFTFQTPRRPTPPLPSIISREPFTNDRVNEGEPGEDKSQQLSQTNLSQNKPRTVLSPSQTQSVQFITPQTFKSRTMIDKVTPYEGIGDETTPTTENDETEHNTTQSNVDLQSSNASTFSVNHNSVPQETANQSMPQRPLGPFQDIPSMFKMSGYSMRRPKMPAMPKMKMPSFPRNRNSNYFTFLCITVCILLMAIFVPYIIALFVAVPFCDTGLDAMTGRYGVWHDSIPLEHIMQCRLCPFEAKCVGGSAVCSDTDHYLDENATICLPHDNDTAAAASRMAHEVNVILGKKLGEWECSMQNPSISYEMNEDELKDVTRYIAKDYYNEIRAKMDENESTDDEHPHVDDTDDDNESIESVFERNETCTNDEITKPDPTTSWGKDEADEFADVCWDYAQNFIIPNAYINVAKVGATLVYNDSTKTYIKSLREIPTSNYCKAVLLYRHYTKNINTNYDESRIIAGFLGLGMGVAIFIVIARRVSMNPDPDSIAAGDFVLQKLSQQQSLHFSIDQFKRYTMRNHDISLRTWQKVVKYVNESSQVEVIAEDVDGEVRMCWKWKAPVPYIGLL